MKMMHMCIEKEVAHVYHVIRHPSLMTGHRSNGFNVVPLQFIFICSQ